MQENQQKSNLWKQGTIALLIIVPLIIIVGFSHSIDRALLDIILGLLFFIFLLFIYFLPWIIAENSKHTNENAIFVLNLLAGWTFVGWIVALVWAFTAQNTKLICPQCKTQNAAGSQFCNRCAAKFF